MQFRILLIALALLAGTPAPAEAQPGRCGTELRAGPGDTLRGISGRCGIPLSTLRRLNPGLAARRLPAGTAVRLNATPSAPAGRRSPIWGALGDLAGIWSLPGGRCDRRPETWRIGPGAIRMGLTRFAIRGVGGAPGALRVDLVHGPTSQRRPIGFRQTAPDRLEVTGARLGLTLTRCAAAPPARGPVITRPLEDDLPTTDEIARALGLDAPTAPGGTGPGDPDTAFAAMAGGWRSAGGGCDGTWRIEGRRLVIRGTGYRVANLGGTAERIGINALRESDGAPATFTLTPDGANAALLSGSVGAGAAATERGARLSRC